MKKVLIIFIYVFLSISAKTEIIYVNHSSSGDNSGKSWNNAFNNLQEAIYIANDGDEIWVANGVYKPTAGTERGIYFPLKSNTKIYGGFDGTETSLDQRDSETNVTILSGDIGMIGDDADNSYNVIRADSIFNARLDGFTISNGRANKGG